jgi:hypothetical protein
MLPTIKHALLIPTLLLTTNITALAQNTLNTPFVSPSCNAGIMPDGFIDWSKLPPPPAPMTANVDHMIQVTGLPGLNADFQLVQNGPTPGSQTTPIYTVSSARDITILANVTPTIHFNHVMKGVSVTVQGSGRFGFGFSMTAYNEDGNPVGSTLPGGTPNNQVSTGGYDLGPNFFNSNTLQIRSEGNDIASVTFNLTGGNGNEGYGTFTLSNFRIESGSAPDPALQIPFVGMRTWLKADNVVSQAISGSPDGNLQFTNWPNEAVGGADAVHVTPGAVSNAPRSGANCTPAVAFTGPQDAMSFNLPINGWTGMTVFMAISAANDAGGWWENQAILWPETEPWGTTFFTPSQSNVFFRFGTGQVGNQPIHPRLSNLGGDFTVTTAMHDGTTDSLWVNGQLALREGGTNVVLQGTSGTVLVGQGLLGTYFAGSIGEILVYDRALTEIERQTVQQYLFQKYVR